MKHELSDEEENQLIVSSPVAKRNANKTNIRKIAIADAEN